RIRLARTSVVSFPAESAVAVREALHIPESAAHAVGSARSVRWKWAEKSGSGARAPYPGPAADRPCRESNPASRGGNLTDRRPDPPASGGHAAGKTPCDPPCARTRSTADACTFVRFH